MTALLLGLTLVLSQRDPNLMPEPREAPVAADLVIALETSAVMKPTLANLQQNLWTLARLVRSGDTREPLRLGFVFYRPGAKPDVVPLTDDLDAVAMRLRQLETEGEPTAAAPVGEALRLAVTEMPWRDNNRRRPRRDIVVIGRDAVADLALAKTSMERARADGIVVHAVTLRADDSTWLAQLVTSLGGRASTVTDVAPVAATPNDAALHKALMDWSHTLVFGGMPDARKRADDALALWRTTPRSELLERATFLAVGKPSQPVFRAPEGALLLVDDVDDLTTLPKEQLPEAYRQWSATELQAWAQKTAAAMERRDDAWRKLAQARAAAPRPANALVEAVSRSVRR